jgi:hypothetical protein
MDQPSKTDQPFFLIWCGGQAGPSTVVPGEVPPSRPASSAPDGVARWGQASLLIGLTLFLIVPAMLIGTQVMLISAAQVHVWDRPATISATIVVIGAILVIDALGLFACLFSLSGLMTARRQKQPAAVHLGATILGVAVVFGDVLFTIAAIASLIGLWHLIW